MSFYILLEGGLLLFRMDVQNWTYMVKMTLCFPYDIDLPPLYVENIRDYCC